ncbi:MAG: DUF1273 domain-containing protein [Enterococcus sp.]
MTALKTIYLTGYKSFELGVFTDKDPKIQVVKNALKNHLSQLVEEGLEWVIAAGNLGVELWGAEVVFELQATYPELKLALIFPFAEFGSQWNEANQAQLAKIKAQAAYVNTTSQRPYQNPQQLKNHTQFLLTHTDGALLVYDDEFEGKTKFFLKDAQDFAEKNEYFVTKITMDDLQNTINE